MQSAGRCVMARPAIKPASDPDLEQAVADVLESGDYHNLVRTRGQLRFPPRDLKLRGAAKAYQADLERSLAMYAERGGVTPNELEKLCEAELGQRTRQRMMAPLVEVSAPAAATEFEHLHRSILADELAVAHLTKQLARVRKRIVSARLRRDALAAADQAGAL